MKIYLLTQAEVNNYDTYDSMVVIAESAEKAQHMHPCGRTIEEQQEKYAPVWATSASNVIVTLIGDALENLQQETVVCASYNAG